MFFYCDYFFNYWQLIEINFLINFLINFFIIAINLFKSNYWLLFEAMVVHGVLGRVLDCQGMTESVMVGRESDMQECPPRGSPVCPPRGSPVCPHRQACPPSRRDSHCETLK